MLNKFELCAVLLAFFFLPQFLSFNCNFYESSLLLFCRFCCSLCCFRDNLWLLMILASTHTARGWNNGQFVQLFAITCNYPQSRLRLMHCHHFLLWVMGILFDLIQRFVRDSVKDWIQKKNEDICKARSSDYLKTINFNPSYCKVQILWVETNIKILPTFSLG